MKISVCITIFNEEESISNLLESLLSQSRKSDEIVAVDGGSEDKTAEIIRHFQKKDKRIRLLVEKCSRARGRNLGIEMARNEIIAMTDAGCIPQKDWLKNLAKPFDSSNVDVVAGFYKMVAKNDFEKAESIFLGVSPSNFDIKFLPSTRSVAFTKSIWEKVGGFPERLEGAAEDTVFNYKLIKAGAKISRMKNAIVEWGMPQTAGQLESKIYEYAKGDAQSRIWIFLGKGLSSHNVHSLLICVRYLIGFSILVFGFFHHQLWLYGFMVALLYLFCSYRKAGIWGPVLQIVSDVAVMSGFIAGLLRKCWYIR